MEAYVGGARRSVTGRGKWGWALAAAAILTPPGVCAADTPGSSPEPIGSLRELYDGTLTPDQTVSTLRNIDRLLPTRSVSPSPSPRPLVRSERQLTRVRFNADGKTYDLFDVLALNRVAGLLVLKDGKVAYETYQYGNTPQTRWTSMSMAKSITSTLIGAALQDGDIRSLDDDVVRYVPQLRGTAYDGVSIRDVLMMSSGVAWNETYTDPGSDRRRFLEAQIAQKPGAVLAVMAKLPRVAEPGARNNYSTGETQIAGEIVRGAVRKPLADYLSEKIWRPYGMEGEARWWLDSPAGAEIAGTGLAATLRDFARFGQFVLEDGVIDGKPVLPKGWVAEAGSPTTLKGGQALDYGYMWWIAKSPSARAHRAFYAVGINGQFIYIDPTARVVITVMSAEPKPVGMRAIPIEPFFDAVVAALN